MLMLAVDFDIALGDAIAMFALPQPLFAIARRSRNSMKVSLVGLSFMASGMKYRASTTTSTLLLIHLIISNWGQIESEIAIQH